VGWRGNSYTQQEGAGSRHMANSGADGIGHLRTVSRWSNGWIRNVGLMLLGFNVFLHLFNELQVVVQEASFMQFAGTQQA